MIYVSYHVKFVYYLLFIICVTPKSVLFVLSVFYRPVYLITK